MDFMTEEAALRDPKSKMHASGREGMWAGLLMLAPCYMFWAWVDAEWIPSIVKILLSLLVAAGVGTFVGRRFAFADARRRADVEEDYRRERDAETERQLAEMKARQEK